MQEKDLAVTNQTSTQSEEHKSLSTSSPDATASQGSRKLTRGGSNLDKLSRKEFLKNHTKFESYDKLNELKVIS